MKAGETSLGNPVRKNLIVGAGFFINVEQEAYMLLSGQPLHSLPDTLRFGFKISGFR